MTTGFDAWNSPGWTIQHPVYSTVLEDDPDLPVGVTRCVITGTYLSASGKAYPGTVTLRPSIPRVLLADTQVMLPPARADIHNGVLTVVIYAVPQDVIWSVSEAVGPSRERYDVIVPRNTAEADLTELERVTPESPPQNPDNAGFLFTGEGPPPDVIEGAFPGDTYLDTLTGDLWTLS